MAPEFADGAVLSLVIARVQANRSGTQGIHEQTIASAGSRCEQHLPGHLIAFNAAATEIPVQRIEVFQVLFPGQAGVRLHLEQIEGAFEMGAKTLEIQCHSRQLHAAEVKEQRKSSSQGLHSWVDLGAREAGCGVRGAGFGERRGVSPTWMFSRPAPAHRAPNITAAQTK